MRVKKMNEKKREHVVDVLVIRISLHSHLIDVTRAQRVFLEKEYKKRILISHKEIKIFNF